MIKRILSIFILTAVCAAVGWTETFIIVLLLPTDKSSLEKKEKQHISAFEDGLMDTLFVNGHVFFNTYGLSRTERKDSSINPVTRLIQETEADYYIEIEPDESGAKWRLFDPTTMNSSDSVHSSAYEALSQTISKENTYKRWDSLGKSVGQQVLKRIL